MFPGYLLYGYKFTIITSGTHKTHTGKLVFVDSEVCQIDQISNRFWDCAYIYQSVQQMSASANI